MSLLVAIALLLRPAFASANPEGGVVAAGQANILTAPATVDIHQQTHKVVIDWRSFDIAPDERTEFHQPSASAIALNRVNSPNASTINGTLKANGNIIIVNQNGVLFGREAKVDVNGLVATSADTDNDRFMNESQVTFDKAGSPDAVISNDGTITAKESGLVGFVAPRVENNGVITARLGRVQLASGEKATVDFYGDGLLEVAIGEEATHQLVKNTGTINAQGGTIALTAAAGRKLLSSGIEVGGTLNTQAVHEQEGKIIIAAAGKNAVANNIALNKNGSNSNVASTVTVKGKLHASGDTAGERGGNITITGDEISLKSGANISAKGAAGGGVIRIGGEYLGGGTTPTARNATVESGAIIDASATEQGHGGEVILFADGDTIFNGLIYANGAGVRGNGGFVETSGKSRLHIGGAVEAIASQGGLAGQWLLDPADITITAATDSDITASSPFTSTNTASQLSAATVVAALNLGTNVTVQTNNDGFAGNGDIFVNSAITSTGAGALTISAFRNILVNAAISLAGGDLTLRSDNTGIGSGAVSTSAAISTNGGNITIGGGNGAITAATYNANGSVATAASGFATGNAAIANGVTIGGAINSGNNGNIIINGRGLNGTVANFGVEQLAGNAITATGTGSIRISGIAQGTGANANSNFGVALRNNVTTQNGVLQINGRGGNGTGQQNIGVLFSNAGGLARSTGTGAITVSGIGGTGTAGRNHGVLVNNTSGISPTGGGAVLIYGQGGSAGVTNTGVAINDSGTGSIVAGSSALTINGFGGASTATGNHGIALTGTGAGIGAVTSTTGVVTLTGTGGGAGASSGNHGIFVTGTGATIAKTGAGAYTLTGTGGTGSGGSNHGIYSNIADGITSAANATLNATAGSGANSNGIVSDVANGIRTTGAATLTLFSDSFNIAAASAVNSITTLTVAPLTAVTFGLGTGAGVATINNASLSNLAATTGYIFGSATTPDITVNTTAPFTNRDLTFISSGNITLNNSFQNLNSLTTTAPTGTTTIAAAQGLVTAIGAFTATGRDIIFNANLNSSAAINAALTRDVTVAAGATLTTGATSALTLTAANNNTNGTGNLTINGNLSVGTGNLTLLSGVNGTRPSFTATAANLIRQGATFGTVSIRGFQDLLINRDINSSAGITLFALRDLTLNAANTLTTGAAGGLDLRAAGGNTGGTGNLNLNGNVSVGTGTVTFRSGANGTRPSYTITATNFVPQSTFGAIDIQGFQDTTINRDITSSGNITVVSRRDLTLNAANTLTTGAGSGLTLQAANNNVTGTGNLNLNGTISVGTGALNLRSGVNGTRPSYTLTTTNVIRQGATFGAIDIRGFLDTFVNRDLNSNNNVVLIGFRDLTLNAANIISTGAGNGLNIQAANGNQAGTGRLNLNGTLSNGTGALTLISGINGTRPSFTATTTSLIRQGTRFGAIDIRGFANFIVDRVLNTNSTVAFSNNTLTTLRNDITSTGNTITFTNNPIVVNEGFSPIISTVNANITFSASTIADTAGGATEGLTLSAGTGTISSDATIDGVALNASAGSVNVTGVLGGIRALGNSVITATANHLTLPTITALSLNASTTGASANQLNISGPITTTGASGLTLTSAGSIAKTGAGNLSSGTGPMALNATGAIHFASAGTNLNSTGANITLTSPVGIVNTQSLTVNTANGNLSYAGPVIVGAPLTLNLGTGAANFSSTINGAAGLAAFDVLAVGAGGGGGGADGPAGGGGGSGAAVDTRVNVVNGATYTVGVGGGGGGATASTNNNGRGAAGANGGGIGGHAGATGNSGGGGGGGGFSGVAIGGTFYAVAGGGAGGGGSNEGTANNVEAPGGGSQPNGNTGTTSGGAAANFTGDGGGGGGGGGGFLGGNGQTALTTSGQASGGSNYANPANSSTTITNGNNGNTQAAGAAGGAAVSIAAPRATYYGYAGAGAGGNGVTSSNGTNGGNGVVIIRYTGSAAQALATGTFTSTTIGGDTLITYNSGTTNSFVPLTTCTGNCNLTINAGNVNFGGAIGGVNALDDVTINSTNAFTLPSLSAASLAVTGATNLNGNILIANGPATFNSPITLTGNSSIDTGTGTVTFASTVNGANNLTVDAGAVSLGGAVGGTTPLVNLAITTTNALDIANNVRASSILARTTGATSDITIAPGSALTASGAGDAITLASGRNFINNSGLGLGTMNLTGGGRYLIYSLQPSSDTTGGLVHDFRRFSCAFASVGSCLFNATINNTVTIPTTGNGFIYSSTPGTLTLSISSIGNVIYGNSVNLVGLATDPTTLGQYLNASDFANDVITGSITGSTTYVPGPTNGGLGTYNINYASGALVSELGYNINYANNPTAFTVVPRTVTVSLVGPISRVYDGTLNASLAGSNYAISNLFAGDVLGVSNSSSLYDTRNVGTGKTVTVTGLNLTGAPAANYVLSSTTASGAVGTITARALTIGATGINRVYNGLLGATVTLNDNRVAGDTLTTDYTAASFGTKDVGVGKTVTVTGITLSGTDAGNYTFNTSTTTTADITQRALTIAATALNKVYDGNTTTVASLTDNRVAGDVLTTGYSAADFVDQNAGTGKTVTVTGITLGGTDAGNYTFNTSATTTADITQRVLTVTANPQAIIYGTAAPAGTISYGGFITGEDASFLDTAPTVSSALSGILDAGTYAGNYTASGGVDGNYSFTYVAGNLTVLGKILNVTADTKTIEYGTAVPAGTLIYNGFITGEDASFLTTAPTVSSGLSGLQNVGTYTNNFTPSGGVSGNYVFNYVSGDLIVTRKNLNVSADNKSVNYGIAVPVGTLTYSGFIAGEDASFLTTAPTVSSNLSGIQNAGTYADNYIASGGVSSNYNFIYTPGTFTVTPAGLNVTVGNRTVTYGVAVPTTTLVYTGFVTGEDETFLTAAPTISSLQSGIVGAGTYTGNYVASGGVSANYAFNYVAGDLTVTPKPLNVTVGSQTVTYGTAVPTSSLAYTGFIAGEDETFLITAPTISSSLSGVQNVGTYTGNYTAAGGVSPNYTFNYVPGNLVVGKKDLLVTANHQNITYGMAVPVGTLTYSGFITGENASFLTTAPTVSSGLSGIQNAGTYAGNYTVAGGVASNYSFIYNVGDLVVSPAPLNIAASGINRAYGAANSFSGYLSTGLQNGETIGAVSLSSNATLSGAGLWNVGNWLITPSAATGGTFNPANYSITYQQGPMIITPRALTIGAVGINKVFDGTTLANVTLNDNRVSGDTLITGFGAANFASSLPATGITVTVTGITLGGADAGNYTFNTSAFTIADITGSAPPPPPPAMTMTLPNTVVRVTQNTGDAVTAPTDDGVYASPVTTYQLVYLPANAPLENRILNRPPAVRSTTTPLTTAFVLPDEEKRLRNARNKRSRSLLARGSRTFIFDANIPAKRRPGGFEASPSVKSI